MPNRGMQQQRAAALIGGSFGLVFVLANAGPPLSATTALALRILAIAILAANVVRVAFFGSAPGGQRQRDSEMDDGGELQLFGRRYWLIVAGEVALLVIGLQVLRALGVPQQANVAWIVLVVGLHFLAFGVVGIWPRREALSGMMFVALGAAGLALAGTDAVRWIPLLSGVLPGFMLLFASCVSATR